jgi:hypothetical protein
MPHPVNRCCNLVALSKEGIPNTFYAKHVYGECFILVQKYRLFGTPVYSASERWSYTTLVRIDARLTVKVA